MSLKRIGLAVVVCVLLALVGFSWLTVQPVFSSESAGPAVKADPMRLEASVNKLAVELHPRGCSDVENLDRAAAWLSGQLPAPTEQTWSRGKKTYRNVSAIFGPRVGPRIVVGAHYDTAFSLPGADDNASGVAAVLELARLFGEHPPPFSVELVFWSLEEPPYFATADMGSVHHADALAAAGVDVRAAISLETIGYFSDAEGSQHFPVPAMGLLYPTTGNHIVVVGDLGQIGLTRSMKRAMRGANDLPVASANIASFVPGVDWSDHRSYWAHGWPAVMVTDTAPNRNPNYHQPSDLPGTLDYRRMAKVVEGVHSALYAIAAR
ncbi:MAG: M28 family peptidase [Archangiaceae bacterium]|nr:M28 family peptidase [Archangiaceae bacterium]